MTKSSWNHRDNILNVKLPMKTSNSSLLVHVRVQPLPALLLGHRVQLSTAGTWRRNDVILTSMRRDDVA